MTTPRTGRMDWPALNAKYGKGRGAAVMARAIRGEMPGGDALLDAQSAVNAMTKWGEPEALSRVVELLDRAWEQSDADGADYANAVGCCHHFAVLLSRLIGSQDAADAFGSFCWLIGSARDRMADEVMSRYQADGE